MIERKRLKLSKIRAEQEKKSQTGTIRCKSVLLIQVIETVTAVKQHDLKTPLSLNKITENIHKNKQIKINHLRSKNMARQHNAS